MKKFTSVLLILVMLVSVLALSSCSKTTEQIVNAAMKKLDEANAVDASMKMSVKTDVAGVATDTEMTYSMKMTDLLTDAPKFSATASTKSLGMTIDMDMYCDGTMLFLSMLGQKMKVDIKDAAGADYDMAGTLEGVSVEIPEEILSKTEYSVDEEGNYVVKFELTGEEFAAIFSELAADITADVAETVNGFSAVKYELIITPDLDLKRLSFEIPMSMTVEGTSFNMTTALEITFNSYADSIDLDVPTDLDSYVEMPNIG